MQKRVKWIEVLKGLAVVAMYIGCFGSGGTVYELVSTHHAALFFCVFGLVETFENEERILKYISKKIRTVLIPCFVLAFLVVIMITIQYDCGLDTVKGMTDGIVNGIIRNTFVADSLWYLTCLFSIQLLFFMVNKIKWKWLVFCVCLGLHIGNVLWINTMQNPSWPFNVDSAFYYLVFYAIGYFMFPYVDQLFKIDTRKKKVVIIVTGIISLLCAMEVFFWRDILTYPNTLTTVGFIPSVRAAVIIWLYFIAARWLQNVKLLADIGDNLLYLCGSLYMFIILTNTAVSIIGLSFGLNSSIQIFAYLGILIVVGNKYLVPIERYLVEKIVKE